MTAEALATVSTVPPPPAPRRDEGRAWYDLAFALHAVSLDCAGAPGIDYERLAQRVQTSANPCDLPHDLGRGHVRADPVEARISRLTGRPLRTARHLRASGLVLSQLSADRIEDQRGLFLDGIANAVADGEERLRWGASTGRDLTDKMRRYARAALIELWELWFAAKW